MRTRFLLTLTVLLTTALLAPVALAQAAAAAGTTLEPGQTNESVIAFIWAYASAAFLQWWKTSGALGLTQDAAKRTKQIVAVVLAFAGALGVHSSFDAASGTLTITGLLLPGVLTAAGDAARQFVFQQFIYRTAIEP